MWNVFFSVHMPSRYVHFLHFHKISRLNSNQIRFRKLVCTKNADRELNLCSKRLFFLVTTVKLACERISDQKVTSLKITKFSAENINTFAPQDSLFIRLKNKSDLSGVTVKLFYGFLLCYFIAFVVQNKLNLFSSLIISKLAKKED